MGFGIRSLIRNFTLREERTWMRVFSTESWSGKPVTPDTAMQISAFWACVRLTAQTIATLPLGIYSRSDGGGRDARADHPLYSILHDLPNADQTAVEFWEGMAACLCIWGNAFAEVIRAGSRIVALHFLRPDLMSVYRDQNGALRYRYSDRPGARELGEGEILHIRGFGFGGDLGLSPVAYARQTLGLAMATEEAAARTFSNGMRPGGFFTYEAPGGKPGTLTSEQREQAKKVLIDPYTGAENAGRIGILEGGFRWQDVSMPPKDAEMLGARAFNVEEVCRWLGTPPVLIGHAANGVTAWGTGIESLMLGWLQFGLRPYLTRIEQAIKRCLIAPAERATLYAEFNVEGLLRADSTGRAKLYSVMAQNGINTRNEIRARENLPAMPGGDDLTVQSNLLPIHLLGKVAVLPREKPVDPGAALENEGVPNAA